MSSPVLAPAGGNVDRGPAIMAILWTQAAVCVLVMVMRFWARISIRAVGLDDWIMLFTLINFIVFSAIVTVQALHGGDRHLFYVEPDQQTIIVKLSWLGQPFAIIAICLAKVSVAFLLLRLIGPKPKWAKYFLYFTISSSLILTIIDIILTFVQCSPARALWEPQIPHTCWKPTIQSDFAIFVASWLVFIDAALAIMPVFVFGRLKISLRKKVGICILLGSGILAAICGAVKTSFLNELSHRADITWETYNVLVWSASEAFILIICGSIPPLKIIFDRYIARKNKGNKEITDSSSKYFRSEGTSDSFPLKAYATGPTAERSVL